MTILGSSDRLPAIIRLFDVERVIVAFSNETHEETLNIIRSLKDLDVQVDIVPRLFEIVGPGVGIHTVEGLPLVGLRPLRLSRSSRVLKRTLDLVASSVGLLLLAPVFLVIGLLIKKDSPGPVFFRQERMGVGDKTFRIFKFRTMVADADERKAEYAHLNRHAQNGGDPRMFKVPGDPRVTQVRALSAPLLARRASAAPERLQGRDESRRPSAPDPRRAQPRRRVGEEAARPQAGNDGTLAGSGPQRDPVRRDDSARLSLRDQLVAQHRSCAHLPDVAGGISPTGVGGSGRMKGIKVVHAVGARPNFVKMAPVVQALATRPAFDQRIVHTGQHYDPVLSDEILADLDFPAPTDFLGVGSGSHGEQTARALESFERILVSDRPDLVVVAGDVNSTLACALAAAKLGIAIGHVESGLRSGDWSMPEEINRVLTDRLSDFLFTHSPEAIDNLVREGIDPERIHHVGNSMIDSLRRLEPAARRLARWEELGLLEHDYVLVTLHRPANVDETRRLAAVAGALAELAGRAPVVFPIHPRTRKRLAEEDLLGLLEEAGVHCLEPTGYVAFLSLELGAGAIVTDSGGVQEEAAAFGVRCYTLRSTTERPITVSHGTNVVLGEDVAALAGVEPTRRPPVPCVIPLWDGHAGERIADVLAEHFALEARPADVVLA